MSACWFVMIGLACLALVGSSFAPMRAMSVSALVVLGWVEKHYFGKRSIAFTIIFVFIGFKIDHLIRPVMKINSSSS